MTECRVVVVREVGNLTRRAGQVARGVDGRSARRRAPRRSSPAAGACRRRSTRRPRPADVAGPAGEQTRRRSRRRPRRRAPEAHGRGHRRASSTHLGDDAGRFPSWSSCCARPTARSATLDVDDVEPYLGELGTVGRFDLTERRSTTAMRAARGTAPVCCTGDRRVATQAAAPDAGDGVARVPLPAAAAPRRSRDHDQGAGGGGARDEGAAGGARFPSGGRAATRHRRAARSARLLAQAELDLRGQSGFDERTAIDVLVARLAALARRHRSADQRGTSQRSEPPCPSGARRP